MWVEGMGHEALNGTAWSPSCRNTAGRLSSRQEGAGSPRPDHRCTGGVQMRTGGGGGTVESAVLDEGRGTPVCRTCTADDLKTGIWGLVNFA